MTAPAMLRTVVSVLVCTLLVGACPAAEDAITIEDMKLTRNGQPFKVHGVQLMTFVAPLEYLENPPAESCRKGTKPPCPFTAYIKANRQFNAELLAHAKAFGANTILFKVSEAGLDAQDPVYSRSYVDELVKGVKMTRELGFVVILAIQEIRVSGEAGPKGTRSPIPDEGTRRAAVRLAQLFGSDRGIMIELYVEPYARGRVRTFWKYYVHGGNGYPGVNKIIRDMRKAGSKNVLIVEAVGQNFRPYQGDIEDPLGQLVFGVHPYFTAVGTTREQWDSQFGDFAADHPLIVTEWNQNTIQLGENPKGRKVWCESAPMDTPLRMFHYFEEKGILGAIGWAFDLTSTIVKDYQGTPRSLKSFRCGERGGGIGDLFQHYFAGTLPALDSD